MHPSLYPRGAPTPRCVLHGNVPLHHGTRTPGTASGQRVCSDVGNEGCSFEVRTFGVRDAGTSTRLRASHTSSLSGESRTARAAANARVRSITPLITPFPAGHGHSTSPHSRGRARATLCARGARPEAAGRPWNRVLPGHAPREAVGGGTRVEGRGCRGSHTRPTGGWVPSRPVPASGVRVRTAVGHGPAHASGVYMRAPTWLPGRTRVTHVP